MSTQLTGIVVPLVTPFNHNNEIEYSHLSQVIEFVITKGVSAVMIGGTTGEGMLLRLEERKQLLEAIVRQVKGRVTTIAHTGCIDTWSTVELSRHAQKTGVDFISVIVPYFFTLNDDQLFNHFVEICNSVRETPVLLYAFPGNTKNDISPVLLQRLLIAAPNIAGIKSSNDDLVKFQEYVKTGGPKFTSCMGVDELMLGGLVFGSHAQISGNANAFPEPFIKLFHAFKDGNLKRAQDLQLVVNSIVQLHHGGSTTAFYKASLQLRGISAGRVRSPMRELTKQELTQLEAQLIKSNLLETQ